MDKKPVYLCDPEKNAACSKEECYISGGTCSHTFNKNYEKKQTNQDKLAEMVRTMKSKDLAEFLMDDTSFGECPNCPAADYCERYFCTSEDTCNRIPDENGEILSCKEIFERWLKEEAKEEV